MATTFVKGQEVKLRAVTPEGPVVKLRMDEDGAFFYLLEWIDAEGNTQERWFAESDLTAA
jgi:hypothetical protein